jgi:hypothetical protein
MARSAKIKTSTIASAPTTFGTSSVAAGDGVAGDESFVVPAGRVDATPPGPSCRMARCPTSDRAGASAGGAAARRGSAPTGCVAGAPDTGVPDPKVPDVGVLDTGVPDCDGRRAGCTGAF